MVKIYIRKIKAGQMTLEEVPIRWREEVRKALEDEMRSMARILLKAA